MPSRQTTTPPKFVLIDACIVQHYANQDLANGIASSLGEAIDAGYQLATSEYTVFELLDGGFPKKEEERMEAIAGLKQFYVRKKVIRIAARLKCFYEQYHINEKQVSIGDRMLAATSILVPNSLIYTANGADFPQPFFSVVRKTPIQYKKANGNDAVLFDYFLQPDYVAIKAAYEEWTLSG